MSHTVRGEVRETCALFMYGLTSLVLTVARAPEPLGKFRASSDLNRYVGLVYIQHYMYLPMHFSAMIFVRNLQQGMSALLTSSPAELIYPPGCLG